MLFKFLPHRAPTRLWSCRLEGCCHVTVLESFLIFEAEYFVGGEGSDERISASCRVDDLLSHFREADALHFRLFSFVVECESLVTQSDENFHLWRDLVE